MIEISIKIIGPQGSGKTRAARAIIAALYDMPAFPYNVEIKTALDGETEPTLEMWAEQKKILTGHKYRTWRGEEV